MKNVLYSLIAIIFLSCSGSVHNREAAYLEILTPETISFLLAERPEGADPGLYLYRNELSRPLVETFYYQVTADREIAEAILTAADSNDIPLPLAFSLAWGESSYQVRAINRNANSVDRGLFQLNSRSFPNLNEEQFYNPRINARYGLEHFRYCLGVGRNELVALAMYNAGINRVRRGTPYSTLHYVARILNYEQELFESFEKMLKENVEIARVLETLPS
ncbi:MAG: transglycosylase SLT domain-containing protein [Spirochaetaceae bacterium]|nr:MAG: transglycosylase SLT domain-containing protein [Spirochaetaceae bacterium]